MDILKKKLLMNTFLSHNVVAALLSECVTAAKYRRIVHSIILIVKRHPICFNSFMMEAVII